MRDVVAWGVLRARTWVAFAAAFVATNLASGDGRGAWTVIVGLSTCSLAALSVWAHYLDEHPGGARDGEPAPPRSKHEEWVEDSVRRYESARSHRADATAPERSRGRRRGGGGRILTREEAMAAEILRRYEEEAAARRASSRETDPAGGGTAGA